MYKCLHDFYHVIVYIVSYGQPNILVDYNNIRIEY